MKTSLTNNNAGSSLPAYLSIKNDLRQKLMDGHWGDDEKFPYESVLAEEFQASRSTIAKSVKGLVKEGLLFRIRGTGTYINQKRIAELRNHNGVSSDSNASHPITIGILYDDFVSIAESPLYRTIIKGVQDQLNNQSKNINLQTFTVSHGSILHSDNAILFDLIKEKRVHGLICLLELKGADFDFLVDNKIPVVVANSQKNTKGVYTVSTNLYLGVNKAIRHLTAIGKKKITYVNNVSPQRHWTDFHEISLRAYTFAMEIAGLEKHIKTVFLENEQDETDYIDALLKQIDNSSALYIATDYHAARIKKRLEESGVKIPEEIAIVSCNRHLQFEECEAAELTVVECDHFATGHKMAELVSNHLNGKKVFPVNVLLKPGLKIRHSSGVSAEGLIKGK